LMAHAPCHSDSFKRRLSYWCFWSFEKRPVKSYIELHLDLPPKRFTMSSPTGHSHSWILFTRFNLTQCYSYFTFFSPAVNVVLEALQEQAQAEELTLIVAKNKSGYHGVNITHPGKPKPYKAQVAGVARWQASVPGLLRQSRRGGVVCRAYAGGAGGGGEAGCSGAAADEPGGAAAGAGGGADAARGRKQDGLLRREPRQARPAQALPGAGVARWQARTWAWAASPPPRRRR
jgi:hypothetical protein